MFGRWRARWRRAGPAIVVALAALPAAASADPELPEGFQETIAFSGLTLPTAVRFAPDGRIFVAEKSGIIKVFDDFGDPTPSIYADLSAEVYDFWDRGLLGLALDPQFETRPYVYVLYAYNRDPNSSQVPRWPDSCPTPPGATDNGCVVTGRLSRLNGGFEEVLIEDWCQQFPSHSVGSLAFGADGALYASAGDGASFNIADYGQDGTPRNPCGDPPAPVGGALTPPTTEGGALRSQDIRTTGDPTGLQGTIVRLDPDTGEAMPDNPNWASPDPNARRIVAYGLRNPFRIAVRPGTNEVWSGDVGWNTWEEINRLESPIAGARNYGWPCYEGTGPMGRYDVLDIDLCETLYGQGPAAHTGPYYTYDHLARVVPGEACRTGASSISGLAFTPAASSFPDEYDGALFFSDYSRDCIWAMLRGADGLPDPGTLRTFVADAENPAELQFGPNGDLYYVDLEGGNIRRIRSLTANRAPVARATATPSTGSVPLTVAFDASASSDPDGAAIDYAWDLDGDGGFDDSTAVDPTWTYGTAGTYTARLRVTDPGGLSDTLNLPITAGTPPVPVITISAPAPGATWKVDDVIRFAGSARDAAGAAIPTSGLTWNIDLRHCHRVVGTCHTHPLQTFPGVAGGSFPAPDHEFPSYLEIELQARDADGLIGRATRRLDPQTVRLTLASEPAGASIAFGGETAVAPFTREVIRGSTNSIGTESPQPLGGLPFAFTGWSNAGGRNHTTVVNADTTLTAAFERYTARRMAGAAVVGSTHSIAPPGVAEVYRTVADHSGTATELYLFVDEASTASAMELGLYADEGGRATTLLGSGRIANPAPFAWNKVAVHIPGIEAGRHYWIGLLNPADATGDLRWRDRAGGSGGPEEQHRGGHGTLPATWEPGIEYDAGPASAYVFGPPPTPVVTASPGSLAFTGRAGAASPPPRTVSIANSAGDFFATAATDDARWLTVGPVYGDGPRTVTVTVNTAGLAAGVHTATVRVTPAGGGVAKPIPVTLRLEPPPPPAQPLAAPPPAGAVGAWGFDERGGRGAVDASGSGNGGRLSGPARVAGRFGGALKFDGVNDWVTVPDAPSLDLTGAMTLEAWVRPSALGAVWRTVLMKEQTRQLAYALYAGTASRPSGHVFTTADRGLRGPAALRRNRWSHVAVAWDGLVIRAYVNGRRVASHALVGAARTSSGPLRIGGNAVWPEWFKGRIDEVRVYDRALTAAEIARDRATAINPGAGPPAAKPAKGGGKPRKTRRARHRGTRWLR